MPKANKTPDFSLVAKKLQKDQSRMVAVEAKKFFKESFVKGGFTDRSFSPWKQRVGPLGGKKILIGQGNTMNLMQSIRTLELSPTKVRTGTDLVYGEIHNEGGTITVTRNMKKFWWAKYYEYAGSVRKLKNGKISQAKGNLKTNAKAEFCRNMALMKVGAKIRIPKRQYIGESHTLMKLLDDWLMGEIENIDLLK